MSKHMVKLSFLRKTLIGTLMKTKASSSLNDIRRHYWEAQTRGRGQARESISQPMGKPAPGRKTLSDWQPWKAMRRNRTDWPPFY
jgi:hypothetical protein